MITMPLKTLHNISHPGDVPTEGDVIEVECVGGFVCEVDPQTRKSRLTHQRFRLGADGDLEILKRPS